MSEHFINLNCANCGGKLEVYDDMDRFACSYCGTEMLVHRRGGTVALKAVSEAIKKVQKGTDKTAAELAIVRLEKERNELVEAEKKSDNSVALLVLGVLSGLTGIGLAANDLIFGGILLIAAGISAIVFALRPSKAWTKRHNQIRQLERKIAEQKQIAES
jgi:DNA-directed RNA polymerase subunit RPC12/RpoP